VCANAPAVRDAAYANGRKATTGIEPVQLPTRASKPILRPQILGSTWLPMSRI
jgi:hypothetical protein